MKAELATPSRRYERKEPPRQPSRAVLRGRLIRETRGKRKRRARADRRATAAEWRFDAVVSDHRLGAGSTGVELADGPGARGAPSRGLILTGDTDKQQIAEIMSSGLPMLHKPVAAEALREKLAALLSG